MSLRELVGALRNAVTLPMNDPVYRAGCVRQNAELARASSVAGVLEALEDARESTYPARSRLTRALVAEHQRRLHTLWISILIVAYYPMLARLRRRIVSTIPSDERDSLVIAAFVHAVTALTPRELEDRTAMRLRQRTQRRVFDRLRRERMHYLDVDGIEADNVVIDDDVPTGGPPIARLDEHEVEKGVLFGRARAAGVSPRGLAIVEATLQETLRAYVHRTGPEDPTERHRMYERLKRLRTRTLAKLRGLLIQE